MQLLMHYAHHRWHVVLWTKWHIRQICGLNSAGGRVAKRSINTKVGSRIHVGVDCLLDHEPLEIERLQQQIQITLCIHKINAHLPAAASQQLVAAQPTRTWCSTLIRLEHIHYLNYYCIYIFILSVAQHNLIRQVMHSETTLFDGISNISRMSERKSESLQVVVAGPRSHGSCAFCRSTVHDNNHLDR